MGLINGGFLVGLQSGGGGGGSKANFVYPPNDSRLSAREMVQCGRIGILRMEIEMWNME